MFSPPVISEDLTIENFTFHKEALGIDDPSKEIIRDAKRILTKVSELLSIILMCLFSLVITRPVMC
jgi:hypothetical protein